jgi:hypothetical protein
MTRFVVPATRFAPESFFTLQERGLERTGGHVFASPKKGGGAPNGAPQLPRLDDEAQPRSITGPLAFRRSSAVFSGLGQRFLESPDPNGRTLSGTSAASTSQSDHAPDGLMPKPPAG